MLRHCLSRLLPIATTLAALATPALAQDLSPIQTMLETVEAALTELRGALSVFPFPAAIKRCLIRRGVAIDPSVRRPMRGLSADEQTAVDAIVEQFAL